eukprot:jgi/Ulvmu1/3340/UM155_0023.1
MRASDTPDSGGTREEEGGRGADDAGRPPAAGTGGGSGGDGGGDGGAAAPIWHGEAPHLRGEPTPARSQTAGAETPVYFASSWSGPLRWLEQVVAHVSGNSIWALLRRAVSCSKHIGDGDLEAWLLVLPTPLMVHVLCACSPCVEARGVFYVEVTGSRYAPRAVDVLRELPCELRVVYMDVEMGVDPRDGAVTRHAFNRLLRENATASAQRRKVVDAAAPTLPEAHVEQTLLRVSSGDAEVGVSDAAAERGREGPWGEVDGGSLRGACAEVDLGRHESTAARAQAAGPSQPPPLPE